jgi:hypothetical protein
MSVRSKILLQVDAENSVVNLKIGFRSFDVIVFYSCRTRTSMVKKRRRLPLEVGWTPTRRGQRSC